MRNRLLGRLVVMVAFAGGGGLLMQATAQDHVPSLSDRDTGALRHMIEEQGAAWNSGDGPRWARSFSSDSTFINIRGDRVTGHNAIAEMHTRILSTVYRGSTAAITLGAIRPIGPDLALVELEYSVSGFAAMPPGVQPTTPGALRTRMSLLARRVGSQWQWIFAQNTAIAPTAGAPSPSR